jgi:hypothetical protein
VRNDTIAVHPYHLHGFSMQPKRMVDNADPTIFYDFDYDEFVDTIDVYGHQTLVFRTRIDDRPKICDLSPSFPRGLSWRRAATRRAAESWADGCSIATSSVTAPRHDR